MPDLSIKNVPADELQRLRVRARRNHRSLQGELRTILSQALTPAAAEHRARKVSLNEAIAEIRSIALKTPSQSVRMIREDRDGR